MEDSATFTNTKTGEQRTIKRSEIGQYGIDPNYFEQKIKEQGINKMSPVERGIEKTGIFDIPVLGGLARAIEKPAESYGRMVGGAVYEGGRALKSTLGDKNAYVDKTGKVVENPFLSVEELKKFSPSESGAGNVALEGVKRIAGAASYAVPGGGFAKATGAKLLGKVGLGKGLLTARGAGTASGLLGFSESEGDLGESLASGGKSAVTSAILAPFLSKSAEVTGKGISKIAEGVFKKLPRSVRTSFDRYERQIKNVEDSKMSTMVGYQNLKKAQELGIMPDHMPEDVVRIITPRMERVGQELNKVLNKPYATATVKEIKEAILKAEKQVVPGTKDIKLGEFSKKIDNFLKTNILEDNPELNKEQIRDFTNNLLPVGLNTVNKIKIRLGERFKEDPLFKQAYKNIQKLIETNSGEEKAVKALNKQYEELRNIVSFSEKQLKGGLDNSVQKYQVQRDSILNKVIGDPNVNSAIAILSLLASTVSGPLTGVGSGIGLWGTYRVLSALARNKGFMNQLISQLERPERFVKTPIGQIAEGGVTKGAQGIQRALEQLGIRLPTGVMSDQ